MQYALPCSISTLVFTFQLVNLLGYLYQTFTCCGNRNEGKDKLCYSLVGEIM